MSNKSETKVYKTIEDQLMNGAIMQSYGSNYLLSVCPALDIHKVRFSIVKLNTKGTESLDFYLDTDKFRRLIDAIDKGTVAKQIAADKGNFPSAIEYTTGKGGTRKLLIGGGEKGPRVQIKIKVAEKNWEQYMTVFELPKLSDMSFYFKLITGLIDVREGSYYDKLYHCYWDGEEDRKKNFKSSYNPEDDDEYTDESIDTVNETAEESMDTVVKADEETKESVVADKEQENQSFDNSSDDKSENVEDIKRGVFYSLTPIEKKKCGFTCWVSSDNPDNSNSGEEYKQNANRVQCIITPELIESLGISEEKFETASKNLVPKLDIMDFPVWAVEYVDQNYKGKDGKDKTIVLFKKAMAKSA